MNLHWSWLGKITLSGFKSQPKVALFKLFRKIEFCSYFMHFLTSQTFWGKIASHWRNMLKTVVSYVVLVGGLVLEIKHCKKMQMPLGQYKNCILNSFPIAYLPYFIKTCVKESTLIETSWLNNKFILFIGCEVLNQVSSIEILFEISNGWYFRFQ